MFQRFLFIALALTILFVIPCTKASAEGDLKRANELINQGKSSEALEICNSLVGTKDESPYLYLLRGICHNYLKDNKIAVEDYTKALEMDPGMVSAYTCRSNAYVELKEYEKAVSDCDKGLELDPKRATLFGNRGEANYGLGKYKEALEDLNQQISLIPSGEAYYFRGLAYRELGENEKAEEDMAKSKKLGYEPGRASLVDIRQKRVIRD